MDNIQIVPNTKTSNALEEIQKAQEEYLKNSSGVAYEQYQARRFYGNGCPACDYCPNCGRSNNPYRTHPYPWNDYPRRMT